MMLSEFNFIVKSRFVRNVITVASGAAGAQLVSTALSPVITRVYPPEVFGLFGTFAALASSVASISALAYPIAIVLPEEDVDALSIVRFSIYLSLALSIIIIVFSALHGDLADTIFCIKPLRPYLIWVPVFMVCSTWMQVVQQWLIRKKQYNILSNVAIISSLANNFIKILVGFFWPSAIVLIILSVFLPAFYAVIALFFVKVTFFSEENRTKKGRSFKEIMIFYKDFPLYRAPQIFINSISQGIPILLLSSFFGATAAGCYTLTYTVMGLPSGIIGKAVSDVFYPKITEAACSGIKLTNLITKSTGMLLLIGIIPFGLIIAVGPFLFSFFFGERWSTAGNYAQWLALFFLFNLINKPSVAAVPVLGIQKGLLIYEVLSTAGKIIGLLIGFYCFHNDILTIALFSTIGAFAYIIMITWIFICSIRYDAKTSR